MSAHYYPSELKFIYRVNEERRFLITSLANGFDFNALTGPQRHWLRLRRLVNHEGLITNKGRTWAAVLLAEEADRLVAGEVCEDFGEE